MNLFSVSKRDVYRCNGLILVHSMRPLLLPSPVQQPPPMTEEEKMERREAALRAAESRTNNWNKQINKGRQATHLKEAKSEVGKRLSFFRAFHPIMASVHRCLRVKIALASFLMVHHTLFAISVVRHLAHESWTVESCLPHRRLLYICPRHVALSSRIYRCKVGIQSGAPIMVY